MGKINPNGQVIGSIGHFVFVNSDGTTYVRSKPGRVKQTVATKKAASDFGTISTLDKIYRHQLIQKLGLYTDNQYAYRHRSCFNKMFLRKNEPENPRNQLLLKFPKAMVGYQFNQTTEWQDICRFFPDYQLDDDRCLNIIMPALSIKNNFYPFNKSKNIRLTFDVIAVDLFEEAGLSVEICSRFSLDLSPHTDSPNTIWKTQILPENKLIFLIGSCEIQYENIDNNSNTPTISSTYLWAAEYQ